MTYGRAAWELATDTYHLKLQCMQNRILRNVGNFPRCTPVRDLRKAFNLPFVYDYITKLFRQQTKVIQNRENDHVRRIGPGGTRHRKYKGLKLGGGQAYDRSSD
jgi:hypothetical protein